MWDRRRCLGVVAWQRYDVFGIAKSHVSPFCFDLWSNSSMINLQLNR